MGLRSVFRSHVGRKMFNVTKRVEVSNDHCRDVEGIPGLVLNFFNDAIICLQIILGCMCRREDLEETICKYAGENCEVGLKLLYS